MKLIKSSLIIFISLFIFGCNKDTKVPVIEASDITVNEDSDYDFLNEVTVTDNSDNDLTITHDGETSVDLTTPGEYTLTITATDDAGNTATKSITVIVKDITSPVIEINDITVNEDTDFNFLDEVTVSDNYDNDVIVTHDGDTAVDLTTPGTYQLTYTATDDEGNNATKTVNVNVEMVTYRVIPTEIDRILFNLDNYPMYYLFTFGNNNVGYYDYNGFRIYNEDSNVEYKFPNGFCYLIGQIDDVYVVILENDEGMYFLGYDENGIEVFENEFNKLPINNDDKLIIINNNIYFINHDSQNNITTLESIDSEGQTTVVYEFNDEYNYKTDKLYINQNGNFIYSYTNTENKNVVKKVDSNGLIIWEYQLNSNQLLYSTFTDGDNCIIYYRSEDGFYHLAKILDDGSVEVDNKYAGMRRKYGLKQPIFITYNETGNGDEVTLIFIDNNYDLIKYQYQYSIDYYYNYSAGREDNVYILYNKTLNNEVIYFVDVYTYDGQLIVNYQLDNEINKIFYLDENTFIYSYSDEGNEFLMLSDNGVTTELCQNNNEFYIQNDTIVFNYGDVEGNSYLTTTDFTGNVISTQIVEDVYIADNVILSSELDVENELYNFNNLNSNLKIIWSISFDVEVEPLTSYENGDIVFRSEDKIYIVYDLGEKVYEATILGMSVSFADEYLILYVIDGEGVVNILELPYEEATI